VSASAQMALPRRGGCGLDGATHQIDEVVALAVGEEAAVEERPARSGKPRLPVRRGDRKTTGRRSQPSSAEEERKKKGVSPGPPGELGDARRVVEAAAVGVGEGRARAEHKREREGGEEEQGGRRRHGDGSGRSTELGGRGRVVGFAVILIAGDETAPAASENSGDGLRGIRRHRHARGAHGNGVEARGGREWSGIQPLLPWSGGFCGRAAAGPCRLQPGACDAWKGAGSGWVWWLRSVLPDLGAAASFGVSPPARRVTRAACRRCEQARSTCRPTWWVPPDLRGRVAGAAGVGAEPRRARPRRAGTRQNGVRSGIGFSPARKGTKQAHM
jgi:hypothetical protein